MDINQTTAELEKLKRGEFSDDLLVSIINNEKLSYYNSLEENTARTDMQLDAFICGIDWEQKIGNISRMEKMTKQEIMDFAKRHFADNYVAVYKRQGTDPNQKKIDKPAITPIPTNRENVSQFVEEIQKAEVKPIEPQFVDFERDLTFGSVKSEENGTELPYVYVQNKENGRFTLAFRYRFGKEADTRYQYAAEYIDYLGTDSLTAEEVKQQFYKLACYFNIEVGERSITISLNGLAENMPEALSLLEYVMKHAKVDESAYSKYVSVVDKARSDEKLNQKSNFAALQDYGFYGPYNPCRNILSTAQLEETEPQVLLDLLKNIGEYKHNILYYGPLTTAELEKVIGERHEIPAHLQSVPGNRHYSMQSTPQNEILLAPYDAKNIYMALYHIDATPFDAENVGVKALFNEYFGSGMSGIVFQEMREARGLAYNAYARYYSPSEKDRKEYYFTHIITQNDKMVDCISHFHDILNEMPASETAFQIAKDAVTKRLASTRVTKSGVINSYLAAQKLGLNKSTIELVYKNLDKVQLKDIVNFEKNNMANKAYRYIILGDEKELDMKYLEGLGTIKRLSLEEVFGY